MGMTHFPNGFANGVAIRKMPILNMHSSDVFWVDSNAGADTGKGTFKSPFASIDYAIGRCTASKQNMIMVKAGHAETLTTGITADVAGVSIIGLGNGDNRPTLTINAAVYGLTVSADDTHFHNLRIISGSSATAATRLVSVAASDVTFTGCRFELPYDVYHAVVISSGDNVVVDNCEFVNAVTTSASVHPQTALLNIGGTNVAVSNCSFNDTGANKAERWRACVEGGKLTASLEISDCSFRCRGVATATRSAAASGYQATLFCRGISPSSNTAVGSIFTPTYQYIIETYNVAAVNKVGVVTVTTSDLRLKRLVEYL